MIIDTHTHFYDPSRAEGVPWPPPDNKLLYRTVLPEHWRAVAEPEGVTATVVVEASQRLTDNDWILALAADEPAIVGFVGQVAPNRVDFGSDLTRLAANPIFRGIRCGPSYFVSITSGSFLDDMAQLVALDLQLDALLRREHFPGLIALAQRLPTLRIVVDHIGHMPIDGQPVDGAWLDAYSQLAAQPNIFMKVSAVIEQSTVQPAPTTLDFYRPALDAMWHAFGEDRVIYGSNWPVVERAGSYADSIRLVKEYFHEKGSVAWNKYFWQNALAVYKPIPEK